MTRVHIFGSLNADLVSYVDELPKPGETRHGKRFLTAPGGKGLNQAIAAARAGAEVSIVGAVGADNYGRWLIETAKVEGIETDSVLEFGQHSTGIALVSVDDRGENSIITIAGANLYADPNLLQISPGDIVLAQLETSIVSVLAAFRIAKEAGAITILNPAPATPIPTELLSLTDLLIPNEHEAAQISGIDTNDDDGALAAANALLGSGSKACLITLGARGALLVNADGAFFQPAFKTDPLDTTAAGDAFCGAFAAALASGESQKSALSFAAAAGSLATTVEGAVPSLPNKDAILGLLQGQKMP